MRHVLNELPYVGKEEATIALEPDPSIVSRFHRSVIQIDT